jgi:Leucine-rich repeat (LRR) protein
MLRLIQCGFLLFLLGAKLCANEGWTWCEHFPWVYNSEQNEWQFLLGEVEVWEAVDQNNSSRRARENWRKYDSTNYNYGWLWTAYWPFSWSYKLSSWLYFSSSTPVYYYSEKDKKWAEYRGLDPQYVWQFDEWMKQPDPYGGEEVLNLIARAKKRRHEWIDLSFLNISDITPLASLSYLGRIVLSGNNVSDLSPIASLTKLRKLDLNKNNITELSPIERMMDLVTLDLSQNNIEDISPLAELKSLSSLDLSQNNISELAPIAEMKNLVTLDLSQNNISDLSVLTELTQLKQLYLQGNNFTNDQRTALEAALPNLESITW